jgi:hypothetical protein
MKRNGQHLMASSNPLSTWIWRSRIPYISLYDELNSDLIACDEMLAEDEIDHDRHLKYIVRIRYLMFPDAQWGDVSD